MQVIKFTAMWAGESSAGIRAGNEDVAITFSNTLGEPDADTIEYFREAIAEYFDGAKVHTETELNSTQNEKSLGF